MSFRRITLIFVATVLAVVANSAWAQAPTPLEWKLGAHNTHEEGKDPAFTITISQPTLEAAKADAFNKEVDAFIAQAVSDFKKSVDETKNAQVPVENPSALDIGHDDYVSIRGLVSTRFTVSFYIQGAAHPASYTSSLNYDLNSGQVLQLASLFKPGAKYLDVIARYAINELKKQNRISFPEGATAKAENYARWNIDRAGILITFDPYQVGPYAQGPSEVLVPYSVLNDILKPDSLLVP
jgi:Protein of unknown function (DUF3298)